MRTLLVLPKNKVEHCSPASRQIMRTLSHLLPTNEEVTMISSLTFVSAATFASVVTLLVVSSTKKWHDETEADMTALCDDMETSSQNEASSTITLEDLPLPIQSHLQKALGVASPNGPIRRIKKLSIKQRGRFLLNGKWIDFTARQMFSASNANPGFVWEANMRLPILSLFGRPLLTLPIHVKDTYVKGSGTMVGKLLGALTIVDMRDTAELNEGELSRWFGECIVFPTALIPVSGESEQKLRWKANEDDDDEETAKATGILVGAPGRSSDGMEQEVKTEIEFRCSKETGLIETIYALRPYAEPGQKDVKMLPWEGHFSDYQNRQGILVPTRMEVGWWKDGDLELYFQGENDNFDFAFEYES